MVIMVVTGLLSVMVWAAIGSATASSQLNSAANKLASDLRYAQSLAAGTAVWYGVSFEVNPTNQYTIYTTTGTVDTVIEDPAKFGSGFVVNTNTTFGVTLDASIGGGKKVEFSPIGTPYTDKSASGISAEGVVTLSKGTATKTVRITATTGRVYVQ